MPGCTRSSSPSAKPRLVFIANSMYSDVLSGGDIHTLNMASAAIRAGFVVHFLAGHALAAELKRRQMPVTVSLTDRGMMDLCDFNTLGGQLRMLRDYLKRLRGTFRHLEEIGENDIVYANTDFWWDSVPAVRCRARRKMMILGMDCPSLAEIIKKSRPDIKGIRLPSVHYWLSQHLALRWFKHCRSKRLLYIHPNQKARLRGIGYSEGELHYVSNGFDLEAAQNAPAQEKTYDAIWTGRVHQQKGVEDLVETVASLARDIPAFRAVMVGNLKQTLAPRLAALGLSSQVDFPGFVSETEKFRLLKASRVFLMPSRYESWGIVIAEALASCVPVVAYELDAYRPVFGDLLRYVRPFDVTALKQATAATVRESRAGKRLLDQEALARFISANSWEAAGHRFVEAVESLRSEAVAQG